MRNRVCALMVVAACFASSSGIAGSGDPVAAEALFRQGRNAMKIRDYDVACQKFAESQRLDPAPGTLINLAQCEEAQGKTASAWQHWREAAEQLNSDDPRLQVTKSKMEELERRLPRLSIAIKAGSPDATKVTRDGAELGSASLGTPLPLDPGEHVVVVSAAGKKSVRTVVVLKDGETKSIEVAPEEGGLRAADQPSKSTVPWRTIGYVVGGVGIVGLGVGTVFALKAKSKDDEARSGGCNDTTCPWGDQRGLDLTTESQDAASVARIAFVLGGIGIAGGAAMVLLAPSSPGTSTQAQASKSTVPWRTIGYVVGAVGMVGLGAGTVFALKAKSKDDEARSGGCDGTTCPWGDQRGLDLTSESQDAASSARIAFILGGVAIAGGAAMVLTAPSSSGSSTQAQLRVGPTVGSGNMGLAARGVWW